LFKIPTSGLRFFTVYGPWGRPDMAPMLFAKAIAENKEIKVFNNGNLERDFTYISDIVEGINRIVPFVPNPNKNGSRSRVVNIGKGKPIKLMHFINALEMAMGKETRKEFLPMQDGDVFSTFADISSLSQEVDYKPVVDIEEGVKSFVSWFKLFYKM
jgi:UDP-glucuronate 4-epimerase